MAREYSNRLYELYEDGMFNTDQLVLSMIMWMSERDVKEFVQANQFFGFSDLPGGPQDPDADDGQPDEAQEWHDFDPDC